MLELKAVKVNKALSEETLCFSASVYVNGVRAATVGNRGHGGNNEWDFVSPELAVEFEEAWKALADDWGPQEPLEIGNGETVQMDWDADLVIDRLMNDWELRKLAKSMLRKGAENVLEVEENRWTGRIVGLPPGDKDYRGAADSVKKGAPFRVLAENGALAV